MKKIGDICTISFLVIAVISCIAGFVISLGSCSTTKTEQVVKIDTVFVTTVIKDTVLVDNHEEVESLAKRLKQAQDSTKFYRDSVTYENYINARRIEKINYYLNCVKKNSKNKKYFYGWIKRTMSE